MNVTMIGGAILVTSLLAGCQTPGAPQYANTDALNEGCPSGVTVVTNTREEMQLAKNPNAQTNLMKQAEGRMAAIGIKKNEPPELRNNIAPEESLTSKTIRGC